MGLLKKPTFSLSFWFGKICLISWYLWLKKNKSSAYFVNVFWCTISSWNSFHKPDIFNLIKVSIRVEKTFNTVSLKKCLGSKGKHHYKRTATETQTHNQQSNKMKRKTTECLPRYSIQTWIKALLPPTPVYLELHGNAVMLITSEAVSL